MPSILFSPLPLRGVVLRNRVAVSPMCQYSSHDGFANDWHEVHLGSRAVGGAGLVFTEAAAVTPEGRISPQDLGLWKDDHVDRLARIVRFIDAHQAVAGIQLAHAGRKAATAPPWDGGGPVAIADGGWLPVAPSALPFDDVHPVPLALDEAAIAHTIAAFGKAAARAHLAGFRVVEVHAAHGYLLHQFLSPLSNRRDDRWGGSFDGRIRLLVEVVRAVRAQLPESDPLFVRISATDWCDPGAPAWDLEQSLSLARRLAGEGVDLIDCSSGGIVPGVKIPAGAGYQTPFAERIRREGGIATGAVGMIRGPFQAEHVVRTGQADLVLLARQLLRDPYWPLRAARKLGADVAWPRQYGRAKD